MNPTEEVEPASGRDLPSTLRGAGGPGYVLYEGFSDPSVGKAMLDDVVSMSRAAAAGESVEGFVMHWPPA